MDQSLFTTVETSVDHADQWRVAGARAVHPSRCDVAEPLVQAIAEGLAAVAVPWEIATGSSPVERSYELILSTDSYDAWLIHWPPGTGLGAHDHGGSAGAFAVVSGVLEEHTLVGGIDARRRVAAGESVCFDGEHVHAVANVDRSAATSVHVYAPPLRSMGFYRSDSGALVLDVIDEIADAHLGVSLADAQTAVTQLPPVPRDAVNGNPWVAT